MVKINLLPPELQAAHKRQLATSFAFKIALLATIALILLSLILWLRTKQLQQKTEAVVTQRINLEREITLYQNVLQLNEQAQQKIVVLQRAMGSSFDWSRLLEEILGSTAEKIKLTKLLAARKDTQIMITLEGLTGDHDVFVQWVTSLQSITNILEVNVMTTKVAEGDKKVHFKVQIMTETGKPYDP